MKTPLSITVVALSLSACAALTNPSPEEISRLPVVRYGQPAPVDGTLFSKPDQAKLNVQIKQDVYLYRNLVSFDGKNWSSGHDKVGGKFSVALPGDKQGQHDGQSPGELSAEFNLR